MKHVLKYFFQGLLYVVPLAVTIFVLYKAVSIADSIFSGASFLGPVAQVPGFGLVFIVVLVTLAGYLGSHMITAPFVSAFNSLLERAPLVKMIYTSVRDLLKAFVGDKKKFDASVLVSLDDQGINNRFGFVTQRDLTKLGVPGMVAVYVPLSYGMMGELIVVPAERVRLLNVPPADLMKLVVSGGVALSDEAEKKSHGMQDEPKTKEN